MSRSSFWKVVFVIGIAQFAVGILDVAVFNQPIYVGVINVFLGTGMILIAISEKKKWDQVESS